VKKLLPSSPLAFWISQYSLLKECVCFWSISDDDLLELGNCKGKHSKLISDMCKFYRDWHVKSDGVYGKQESVINQTCLEIAVLILKSLLLLVSGVYLHDPVSFVAVVRPDLFTYKKGVVRVETQGICVGHTLMDQGLKRFITCFSPKNNTLWIFRPFTK